jgi:hypothetical protein
MSVYPNKNPANPATKALEAEVPEISSYPSIFESAVIFTSSIKHPREGVVSAELKRNFH